MAKPVSRELWKMDWRVKAKTELLPDIFKDMENGLADQMSIEVFFQVCRDVKSLIKLSETIPEENWQAMIDEMDGTIREFRPIADQYLAWLEENKANG